MTSSRSTCSVAVAGATARHPAKTAQVPVSQRLLGAFEWAITASPQAILYLLSPPTMASGDGSHLWETIQSREAPVARASAKKTWRESRDEPRNRHRQPS